MKTLIFLVLLAACSVRAQDDTTTIVPDSTRYIYILANKANAKRFLENRYQALGWTMKHVRYLLYGEPVQYQGRTFQVNRKSLLRHNGGIIFEVDAIGEKATIPGLQAWIDSHPVYADSIFIYNREQMVTVLNQGQ